VPTEDDLQWISQFVSGLALGGGWQPERGGERFPGVDILFANSAEQRIILWLRATWQSPRFRH